jgi:hypothetical protein
MGSNYGNNLIFFKYFFSQLIAKKVGAASNLILNSQSLANSIFVLDWISPN